MTLEKGHIRDAVAAISHRVWLIRSCPHVQPCLLLSILIVGSTRLPGRWYPRLVKKDGRIQVDGTSYYIKADLAGHHIMLRLNAATRCFDVFGGNQFIKSVPIKGLRGGPMPLEDYIDLMGEHARSEERHRLIRQRRARLQAQQSA